MPGQLVDRRIEVSQPGAEHESEAVRRDTRICEARVSDRLVGRALGKAAAELLGREAPGFTAISPRLDEGAGPHAKTINREAADGLDAVAPGFDRLPQLGLVPGKGTQRAQAGDHGVRPRRPHDSITGKSPVRLMT